jgi:hypothetical protein
MSSHCGLLALINLGFDSTLRPRADGTADPKKNVNQAWPEGVLSTNELPTAMHLLAYFKAI